MATTDSDLSYLVRGFKMLREPKIRLFVALPLAINVIIFALLMTLGFHWLGNGIAAVIGWLPEWLAFLSWILWPLAVVLVLAIAMYSFSTVANLIAAPFNGLLAEKVEEMLTGREVQGRETLGRAIASFPGSILRELRKLLYYALFALVVLVLSFIPPISPFSGLLWFLLGAWMLALEYCDYAMDNHGLSFAESKRRLRAARSSTLPFGLMVMLGTMVPIVNLFIMPAAVCGGTMLWVEKLQHPTSGV
ncbi:MAG TPA: sulfate transporter CysZ [Spongiibacteraceae bacterium]|nr:sulfate transporter CysZ [Spongiibacteraceae bacterium]HCS26584.1 sulfate transporter CysZ [Spongiibacteraceae bacterium]